MAEAKQKRRILDIRKRDLTGNYSVLRRMLVNTLLMKAKQSYYVGLMEDCGEDSKQLFSVANHLLNRKQSSPIESNLHHYYTNSPALPETFINYFQLK